MKQSSATQFFKEELRGVPADEREEHLLEWLSFILDVGHETYSISEYVNLTPVENRLVSQLIKFSPNFVPREQIHSALYFDNPEEKLPDLKIIDVFISKIRKKFRLENIDAQIEADWAGGYKIVIDPKYNKKTSSDRLEAVKAGCA